jgi:DNA polymerase I-like protein with 3'-5' exonuclease and polymerase domains
VEVLQKAKLSDQAEYSALRDAFQLGVDIHTFTAMGMQGVDAMQEFAGLTGDALDEVQKAWKKRLGDKRQHGKIGNLSLLYAMQDRGLQEAAGKVYNVHWTLEESAAIRSLWLDAYPEVDLWHLWTELNAEKSIWMPDADHGGRRTKKDVYLCVTLGGRSIYAFGLNAALSYQDQSTGADILGKVMNKLRVKHNEIFKCAINQVHDELVLEIPEMYQAEYTKIVSEVMDSCANELMMPYGVPSSCSPAIGKIWIKD